MSHSEKLAEFYVNSTFFRATKVVLDQQPGVQKRKSTVFKEITYTTCAVIGSHGLPETSILFSYNSYTVLHSHQLCTGLSFSLTWATLIVFHCHSHPNWCDSVSLCGIDLHFPSN
nr:hypothetical protein HJG59_007850 [Molossus molossus]